MPHNLDKQINQSEEMMSIKCLSLTSHFAFLPSERASEMSTIFLFIPYVGTTILSTVAFTSNKYMKSSNTSFLFFNYERVPEAVF